MRDASDVNDSDDRSGVAKPRAPMKSQPPPLPAKAPTKPRIAPPPPSADVAKAADVPPPSSAPAAPMSAPTPSGVSSTVLPHALREEIWTIVLASVNAATAPLLARQNELEARLDRAERQAKSHPSIPSFPTPPPFLVAPTPRTRSGAPPTSSMPAMPAMDPPLTGVSPAPPPVVRPSHASNRQVASTPPRNVVDLEALARMAPGVEFEGYDGGRRRRRIAATVIGAFLLGLVGLIVATILSHV